MDALGQGKYSVGPPYFNAVFVPLMALLAPFMGIGPLSRWRDDSLHRWRSQLLLPAGVAVAVALIAPLFGAERFNLWVSLAVLLASWVVLGLLQDFRARRRDVPIGRALRRQSASYWGMVLAHAGFAAVVVGVVATSQYSIERDLRMAPGDSETLAGYRFDFVDTRRVTGPNYLADAARFEVFSAGRPVAVLQAEKRRYFASGSVMTEAAIDAGLFRDLYVAMGEPVGSEGAWAIRLHYKPMVRWMWLGALAMGIGGIVTVFDRRYRRAPRRVAVEEGLDATPA